MRGKESRESVRRKRGRVGMEQSRNREGREGIDGLKLVEKETEIKADLGEDEK